MYELVTLEEVKLILGSKDENDGLVTRLISDVSALIETYCDKQFAARDYTSEDYDGDGSPVLYVKNYPIVSIASIYSDTSREFSSSTLIDSDSYVFYPDEGRIELLTSFNSPLAGTGFTRGRQNVRVTYNAGYAIIPSDIKMIASEIIMKKYKTYGNRAIGQTNVGVGDQSIGYTVNDILPEHRDILNTKYRTPNIGIR